MTHPKLPRADTPEVYRLGLRLDGQLGQRLKDAAWQARTSVQDYVEQAIRERLDQEAR